MKQKFSVSVPIVGEKLRSSGRPLPDDDSEEETKVDEIEYDDPVNLFTEKEGCLGGNSNQIFWYVPMGEPNFGIHMNAQEFERRYSKCDPKKIDSIFLHGISHEYFHHIVDSWCVRADIDRKILLKTYEREKRNLRPIHMLEESMAEAFAMKFSKFTVGAKSGAYSLYEPLGKMEVWRKGSIVVANQYVSGTYSVKEILPEGGFTKENLLSFQVDQSWEANVKINSNFTKQLGFSNKLCSGVWDLRHIPFHIHKRTSTDYKSLKIFYGCKYCKTKKS